MSKSDEMDNLIVDLINKFDATYQKIMDELPIKLKDPFGKWPFGVQVTSVYHGERRILYTLKHF